MKLKNRGVGELCLLIHLSGAALIFAAGAAGQSTMPGAYSLSGSTSSPGAETYSTLPFEHYSSFGGNLSAVLPLHHIGGRGEAGFDLVWNLQPGWIANRSSPVPGSAVTISPYPNQYTPGGSSNNWISLGGPGFVYSRTGMTWQACSGSPTYQIQASVTTLVFVGPSNSQTNLVDTATSGASWTNPNSCVSPGTTWDAKRLQSFRSTDGSQIQFNSDSNVLEQNLPSGSNGGYGLSKVSGYLVFPNGVTYRVDNSTVSWIEDRNGNKVTLAYGSTPLLPIDWYLSVPPLSKVTDSLNNVTNINYNDTSCGCITISYTGAASSNHSVQIIPGTLTNNLRSGSTQTMAGLFPTATGQSSGNFNPTVASSIKMPDGFSYTFLYDTYGELARVTVPAGGVIEYDYGDGNNGTSSGYRESTTNGAVIVYRRLQARREYTTIGGISQPVTANTSYSVSYGSGQTIDTITDNDANGPMRQTVHTINGAPTDALGMTATACNAWNEGVEASTTVGTPGNVMSTTVYTPNSQSGCLHNPTLQKTKTTVGGLQAWTTYTFDSYGNMTDQQDFDWASGGQGPLIRERAMIYQTNATYLSPSVNLIRLPASVTTKDGSGKTVALTSWTYDANPPSDAPNIIFHDSKYSTSFNTRGNVDALSQWVVGSSAVSDNYGYDIAGNVTLHEYNNQTQSINYMYNDAGNRYALPITVTDTLNNKTTATYDYAAMKPLSSTDALGHTTTYTYADSYDRVTQIVEPTNGAQTNVSYMSPYWTVTYHDQTNAGDQATQTQDATDGFGRLAQHRQLVDSSHLMVVGQGYDGLGRIQCTTNPSLYTTPAFTPDGLGYASCRTYDALGRILTYTAADSNVTTTSYGTQNITIGSRSTYTQTATVTDPASKATTTATDALGHVTAVIEDPANAKLMTLYTNDPLGNLTSVQKCPAAGCTASNGQIRTFTYDGMSRLASATNPESGKVTYSYLSGSAALPTLQSRTDSRTSGNLTTYAYYGNNLLKSVTYNDGITPNVSYTYDAAGNLKSTVAGTVTTATPSFDANNRPLSSTVQIGSGSTYTMSYLYDLAGDLKSETYPSGRVMTTNYDPSMRPINMKGTAGGTSTPYVQQVGYWPQGSVYVWQYGNNVYPVQSYTKTLQPSLSYATVNNSSNQYLLYLQNNWNANGTVGNDVECFGSAVVNTSMTCLSQGYGYDNLNRLTSAGENYYQNPGSGAGYSRNFSYDEYGNMSVSASSNVPTSGLMPQTSQSPFNTANNQLKTATYADPRGNMTLVAAGSVSMSYDGESRQTKTVDPGTGVTMNYLYDGAGQRVQKQSSNGTTTVDVHDVFGQLVAEYSSVGVTPACTTCYLTYDGLGSVRLVTDQNAGIVTRHDYLPYGEEIPNGSAGRCCNNFGNTANVTQMFTGQERDGGTADLDYFNARHMSNILGRFTQPDPGGAGADVTNPQTWNAYAYVGGNPLSGTDPTGMIARDGPDDGDDCYSAARETPCGGFEDGGDSYGGWFGGGGVKNGHSGGGGSIGGGAAGTTSSSGQPVSASGSSDPTIGETNGLPSGVTVPGPLSPQVLLGLSGWSCPTGVCVPGLGAGWADSGWGIGAAPPAYTHILPCAKSHYGLGGAAVGAIAGGMPIAGTKRFVTQGVLSDSSRGTSAASWLFRTLVGTKLPSRINTLVGGPLTGTALRISGTRSAGAVAGRAVPLLGYALAAYDVFQIGSCVVNGDWSGIP